MALFTATACGQIKEQQGARRVLRRGPRARNAEWKLLCATRNLLKLWRHTAIQRAARAATARASTRRSHESRGHHQRRASWTVARGS